MNIIYNSEFREILRAAEAQGFRVERSKKNQFRFIPPCKDAQIVVVSGTPQSSSLKKTLCLLRNSGLDISELL